MSRDVHVVLLAAGRSSRTGDFHKLLATFDGEALVRRSARTALASSASGVTVVVGHRAADIRAALDGLPVRIVENARFADGLSTSLIAGFETLPTQARGVLVMLADQPFLSVDHIDRLVAAFRPTGHGSLVVATDGSRHFNPVIISRQYATEINDLSGDRGARSLFAAHRAMVVEVEIGRAASFDVDTPQALEEAGGLAEQPPAS